MSVPHDGPYDGPLGIGELAERAGVTVKTVRFYSDSGLLPETARTAGGHRRYGSEALDRLRMIRSLRSLGLGVPEIRRVLDAGDDTDRALEDAVAGQLRDLGTQLTALRWREAALRLVRECPPAERADRLCLVGTLATPPSTAGPARFWRAWLPPRMPSRAVSAFLEAAVPQPPDDPAPAQVLAFARLNALTAGPCSGTVRSQPEAHRTADSRGAAVLYAALAEAYDLADAPLRQGRPPVPGQALDCFVGAYTAAYGTRDTPGFRRLLARQLTADPRIDRYWDLVTEVITAPGGRPAPTPGSAHDWLLTALTAQTAGPAA